MSPEPPDTTATNKEEPDEDEYKTLKYHLLGPSLTKAGQEKVDQNKVRISRCFIVTANLLTNQISEIIYNASKGSKFFNREETRDKILTKKIEQIKARKEQLDQRDLSRDLRKADRLIAELDATRDLTQYVVHVDCDAFYTAVEQLDRPELKDVPFAVGGGVLSTCNYVARQFGCRSGMAGFVAKKICPNLILLKPNFQKYNAKAQEVREILADYDPRFESASIDEAYLNITEYCKERGADPSEVVDQMRREIHEKTLVTVSAGIAANAKLAKICSNFNKPNGQHVLPNDRNAIMAFMRDLPTRKVNGIGRVLERELLEIGVATCGDLYGYRQYLLQLFGEKAYAFLINCYLGLGRTKIQPAEEYERKSVGTESTFHEMSDPDKLREKLRHTAIALEKDMKRAECKGRTLCLKVKLHTFEVLTRQVATPHAVFLADDLYNYSIPMLSKLEQELPELKLRLMGLRCTQLVSTKRPDTRAFFGFRSRIEGSVTDPEAGGRKRKASEPSSGEDGEWEEWPEEELSIKAEDDMLNEMSAINARGEQDDSAPRAHGKEIVPNPTREDPKDAEQWWDCPICGRPVTAEERLFNEHIDLCLSRQTIREAAQADEGDVNAQLRTHGHKKSKLPERKKGRRTSGMDPKQKTLSFE